MAATRARRSTKKEEDVTAPVHEEAAIAEAEPLPLSPIVPTITLELNDDDPVPVLDCYDAGSDSDSTPSEQVDNSDCDSDEGSEDGSEGDESEEADSPLICSLYELLSDESGTNITEAVLGLKDSVDTQNKVLYSIAKLLERKLT